MKEDAIKAIADSFAVIKVKSDACSTAAAEMMSAQLALAEAMRSNFKVGEEVLFFKQGGVDVYCGEILTVCPGGTHSLHVRRKDAGTEYVVSIAMVMAAEAEAMKIGAAAVEVMAKVLGVDQLDPSYVPHDVWTITDIKFPGAEVPGTANKN